MVLAEADDASEAAGEFGSDAVGVRDALSASETTRWWPMRSKVMAMMSVPNAVPSGRTSSSTRPWAMSASRRDFSRGPVGPDRGEDGLGVRAGERGSSAARNGGGECVHGLVDDPVGRGCVDAVADDVVGVVEDHLGELAETHVGLVEREARVGLERFAHKAQVQRVVELAVDGWRGRRFKTVVRGVLTDGFELDPFEPGVLETDQVEAARDDLADVVSAGGEQEPDVRVPAD